MSDAQGLQKQGPKPGSESDQDGTEHRYTYDAWNRLVKTEKRDYSGGTPGSWSDVATYQYDGLNRRMKKVASGETRNFYYSSQWQVLEERVDSATTADRHFVWGLRYVDDLVLRDDYSGGFSASALSSWAPTAGAESFWNASCPRLF